MLSHAQKASTLGLCGGPWRVFCLRCGDEMTVFEICYKFVAKSMLLWTLHISPMLYHMFSDFEAEFRGGF